MTNRVKHPDKKNAKSILEAAISQMKYTLTLEVTHDSSFNIIRNIYECFRMLGDALAISKGIVLEDHVEQVKMLERLNVNTSRPIMIVDKLRRMRHNINYYGYIPNRDEAQDAISFAKSCFEQIATVVSKEVDSSQLNQRLR